MNFVSPKDRPDCEFLDNLPDSRDEYPYMDYEEYCSNCDLMEHCKAYSDFVQRGGIRY